MKNKQTIFIIIGVIAALGLGACLLTPVLMKSAMGELDVTLDEMMSASGEHFIQALADEEYETAYDLCTADLQAQIGGPEDLAAMFSSMDSITSWTYDTWMNEVETQFGEHTGTMTVVRLKGDVTFSNGKSDALEVILYPEIENFSIETGELPYRVAKFSIGAEEADATR